MSPFSNSNGNDVSEGAQRETLQHMLERFQSQMLFGSSSFPHSMYPPVPGMHMGGLPAGFNPQAAQLHVSIAYLARVFCVLPKCVRMYAPSAPQNFLAMQSAHANPETASEESALNPQAVAQAAFWQQFALEQQAKARG